MENAGEITEILRATGDGSVTALLPGTFEPMHSEAGAFSETLFVYGSALEEALKRSWRLTILSVGLGLGYVEILLVGKALSLGKRIQSLQTFERDPEVLRSFMNWLEGKASAWSPVYDAITHQAEKEFGVGLLKGELHSLKSEGRWTMRGILDQNTYFENPFSVICFDAFSRRTSPELWDETFLDTFLGAAAAPQCVFSTYACVGSLKRALIRHRFSIPFRPGFGKKRERILALRGV